MHAFKNYKYVTVIREKEILKDFELFFDLHFHLLERNTIYYILFNPLKVGVGPVVFFEIHL